MTNSISIKGTREGLTITLGDGDLSEILTDLGQHLETQGAFFRGGHVALEAGERVIEKDDMVRVHSLLEKHKMILRTVLSTSPVTQDAADALGLRLVKQAPSSKPQIENQPVARRPRGSSGSRSPGGSQGMLVRHIVRSGQVLRHSGHVTVIGDVNIGAQIVAGGDIVVWGRLLGTAHAGSLGDTGAVVCALDLSPLQLRIGGLVARAGEDERKKGASPELACVRDNAIVVEPWHPARKGV